MGIVKEQQGRNEQREKKGSISINYTMRKEYLSEKGHETCGQPCNPHQEGGENSYSTYLYSCLPAQVALFVGMERLEVVIRHHQTWPIHSSAVTVTHQRGRV